MRRWTDNCIICADRGRQSPGRRSRDVLCLCSREGGEGGQWNLAGVLIGISVYSGGERSELSTRFMETQGLDVFQRDTGRSIK